MIDSHQAIVAIALIAPAIKLWVKSIKEAEC